MLGALTAVMGAVTVACIADAEARDVDALLTARPQGRSFALTMRSEALETHAVQR